MVFCPECVMSAEHSGLMHDAVCKVSQVRVLREVLNVRAELCAWWKLEHMGAGWLGRGAPPGVA